MTPELTAILTIIYAIVVIGLCTFMIKDGLRMRRERKIMERRLRERY